MKDIEARVKSNLRKISDKPTVENLPDKPRYNLMPRARYKESLAAFNIK